MTTTIPRPPATAVPLLTAGRALSPDAFHHIRRHMVLACCKWDPQVGDVSTLAPFPLLIDPSQWSHLRRAAEALADETFRLERAIAARPDLWRSLGIPPKLRRALASAHFDSLQTAPRVMRFDFHPTPDGWRVSEVNSDVPGGYAESSDFPAMMSKHFEGTQPAGDPAAAIDDQIASAAEGRDGPVALVAAEGFMEDQQVVEYLRRRLDRRGIRATRASLRDLRDLDGRLRIDTAWHRGPVAAVVRFVQGEWLPRLAPRRQWPLLLHTTTPVLNPATAILSESKRLPLLWDQLHVPTDAWRTYLPETRAPREVAWHHSDNWLLKTAYCNTGDTVTISSRLSPAKRRRLRLDVTLHPNNWLAQRRFATTPVATPIGPVYPCIGVYVVAGRACGAYSRISPRDVIDFRAIDAALLIDQRGSNAT